MFTILIVVHSIPDAPGQTVLQWAGYGAPGGLRDALPAVLSSQHTGSVTEPMPAPKASVSATGLHNPFTDLSPYLVLRMHRSPFSATHGNTQNPT